MKEARLLFGGALLAAGLAAPQAVGDFVISRDFTGDNNANYVDSYLSVNDLFGNVFFVDEGDAPGSVDIDLFPGEMYTLTSAAVGIRGASQSSMTIIPAPAAALPMLAAGGLLVSRRRRRE